MLIRFDSPRICLQFTRWGSICLVPRVRSTGIFGPGIDFVGPPDRFRGDRIPRDTGRLGDRLIKINIIIESGCGMIDINHSITELGTKCMQRILIN